MKFTVVIGLKNQKPTHKTLEGAFRAFHSLITAKLAKGDIPAAYLNSCWVESTNKALPYFFDDLVSLGHDQGWLKAGKLQPQKS